MHTITFDIAFTDGAYSSHEDGLLQSLMRLPDGIYYRVLTTKGPGGGWPVVEFAYANREQALELYEWYGGGNDDQDTLDALMEVFA